MSLPRYLVGSLAHYWKLNTAVVVGVAMAVSTLAGALLVGSSVRASLRAIVLARIGATDFALTAPHYFRASLAEELALADDGAVRDAYGFVSLEGSISHEPSGRRASRVAVYGVDEGFFRFHGVPAPELGAREARLSPALQAELAGEAGDTLLLQVEIAEQVPGSSLFGRRDEPARTLRLRSAGVLPRQSLGEFSLRASQQAVRAVFLPLERLRRATGQREAANTVLIAAVDEARIVGAVAAAWQLPDLGLRVRSLDERGALSLESETAMLDEGLLDAAHAAASKAGLEGHELLTYLANTIRIGEREIPYSLVTGVERESAAIAGAPMGPADAIILNEWAARELRAAVGDRVELEYYLWRESGGLESRTASFTLTGTVPLRGASADPTLAPEYPGITDSLRLSDWNPPFPVDLSRIRDRDEDYWDRYRTTPKAFVPIERARELWRHRRGRATSLRLPVPASDLGSLAASYADGLRSGLDPLQHGLHLEAVRARGLQAAQGATDFGEYFGYFSFFLIAAALLLAALFFRLGIEQRLREIGLLRAVGFDSRRVRTVFLGEGVALALLGSVVGALGAYAYAGLMMLGLRTVWSEAVGTSQLELVVTPAALLGGVLGGLLSATLCIALTLRGLEHLSTRSLLSGSREILAAARLEAGARSRAIAWGGAGLALALVAAAALRLIPDVAGFFGAGGALLVASFAASWRWLSGGASLTAAGGRGALWLGARNASFRPGRSVLGIALIAFASFVIVAVGAFRHEGVETSEDPSSPSGGFPLLAESLVPLHHDPNSPAGRVALGLDEAAFEGLTFSRFRLRPGEDTSCLNLYRPGDPRILAPSREFVERARFSFASSLAETDEEHENPWLLLDREPRDGAIPAIADQNSLMYVLHKSVGDLLEIPRPGTTPLELVIVAALEKGLFQSELLISERHFLRAFPERAGYRFFLIDAPGTQLTEASGALESRLVDFGLDVESTGERLASFNRVENTYLATFQTLGALGLLLGTVGLATVLIRNALERRRELALLRAVGYRGRHLTAMLVAENAVLLGLGLAIGTVCALVAIAPAAFGQGGHLPIGTLARLLGAVIATGLGVSWLAVTVIRRWPLLESLRSE